LLSRNCNERELLGLTFGGTEDPKYAKVKERYRSDKTKGVDVPFVEYLYLSDMIRVVRKRKLFDQIGYQSAGKFGDAVGSLVSLRDTVAHPTRSLISDPSSCSKLWGQIDKIEEILFQLHGST